MSDTVTCALCGVSILRYEIAVAPEFVDGVRFDFCSDDHQHEKVDSLRKNVAAGCAECGGVLIKGAEGTVMHVDAGGTVRWFDSIEHRDLWVAGQTA